MFQIQMHLIIKKTDYYETKLVNVFIQNVELRIMNTQFDQLYDNF